MNFNQFNRFWSWFWRVQKAQIEPYADYWRDLAVSTGSRALIYVALGDSTTQGIGATRPSLGYVGLIAAKLTKATSRPVRVINISRSGAKIQEVIDIQLPQLRSLNPNLVTLSIGSLDLWQTHSRAGIEDRLRILASNLPLGTVWADLPSFGRGPLEQRAQAISQLIEQLCIQYGLVFAPIHDATHTHHARHYYAQDWFHPSDVGYKLWANTFWPVVAKTLKLSPTRL